MDRNWFIRLSWAARSLDDAFAIGLDSAGNAYVSGETTSQDFPITSGAFQRTFTGTGFNGYVTKLNATGSALVYSTYLNGANTQFGVRVAVDASNNAYVLGDTNSPDFVTTPGSFQPTSGGGMDVFLLKLNPAGSALIYSTFLGGSASEGAGGLAIDSAGNAYVSGGTASTTFPTTAGALQTVSTANAQSSDGFVTKVNAAGSGLIYSTLLRNAPCSSLRLTPAGSVWIAGGTSSPNFPTTPDAFQQFFHAQVVGSENADAFISELSADASTLIYSTYIGGFNTETAADLALDAGGNVYITGSTFSSDYPVTTGAFDTAFKGDGANFIGDGFVTKLALNGSAPAPAPPPTVASVVPGANSINGGGTANIKVTLTGGAPAGGASVALASNNSAALSVPATVVIQPGVESANVTATAGNVSTSTVVTVTATFNGSSKSGTITVGPTPPPAGLSALAFFPNPVSGNNPSQAVLSLTSAAPAGGLTATITTNNPIVTVPASVTVAQGQTSGDFTVMAGSVTSATTVTITASAAGITKQGTLMVTPAVSSFTLSVSATGRSGETVSSSPSGVLAVVNGTSLTGSFSAGTSITLSASDGRDAIWSGSCSSGGKKTKTCSFVINSNSVVSANVQ